MEIKLNLLRLIALLLIRMPMAITLPETSCNRLKIGENWFDKKVVWAQSGRPYNLNVHKSTNSLFFSYSTPETYSDLDFQLVTINLDTGEKHTIAGIRGGCSVAIDEVNDEIYLGGTDGIYKYNMLTRLADFYKEKGKNIWSLFYKKNLFYISYPDQKLHIEIDEKFPLVEEFENIEMTHFHVTSDNYIYFANKTGLFKYNSKEMLFELINHLITVRQIVEDGDGELYVCTNVGVYILTIEGMVKILNVKNLYGLAFDRDNNLIYSDEKRIVKLLYSEKGCLSHKEW